MPAKSRRSVPLDVRLAQSGVLLAAMAVFNKKGYAATRVEDILEAAGIARRTFYRYFESKEEILAALYEVATAEILREIRSVEDDAEPLRGIQRGIDVYLDYHAENAGALRVLLGQSMRPDSQLAPMRRAFRAEIVKVLDVAARKMKKKHAPLVFVALLSALEGVSLELLESDARPTDIDVAKRTIHALLALAFHVPGPTLPGA